jgi:intracellular septation protein
MYKNVIISWSIEFGPIVLFFIALQLFGSNDQGFILSTSIFTVATAIALITSYLYEGRIAWFPLIAGASVILFGVMTVVFQNPAFFVLKDTLYNGIFAAVLLIGALMKKSLLKPLFIALFDMKDEGWFILSVRWGVLFLLLTITNEITWRVYGQYAWVNYKFWSTIITALFGFYQITLSKKYRNPHATEWGMRKERYIEHHV